MHLAHHHPLTLAQGIEPDENEFIRLRKNLFEDIESRRRFHLLSKVPIYHPLISYSTIFQSFPENIIKGIEDIPNLEEAGLSIVGVRGYVYGKPTSVIPEVPDKLIKSVYLVL